MGENTEISWTTNTFNPVHGCSKVSPGCEHCYADAFNRRMGFDNWGPGKPRRTFGTRHWDEPLVWDRKAQRAGVKRYVFCGSMCDVCDEEMPARELAKLWELIAATPNLIWQLLTKRPERFSKILPVHLAGAKNIWLGTTVETPEYKKRIRSIQEVPAVARFISVEPFLTTFGPMAFTKSELARIDLVIVGGESGPGARECDVRMIKQVVEDCQKAKVACYVKQMGANPIYSPEHAYATGHIPYFKHPKGGDPAEWDESLRVREWPEGWPIPHET